MAQASYTIDNLAGAGFRAAINEALAAIVTNNSGATEPATMYAHQWWADTSANMLKRRNAGNTAWVSVMSLSLAITSYMETVLGAANAASARVLLNALSSSGGDLSGALNESRATVASHATTADIWAALGNSINWTGAAVTTTFPAAAQAGAKRRLHCAGACSFVNSATLAIIGNADFVATAGAIVDVEAITTTTFKLVPTKADGTPVGGVLAASGAEVAARANNVKTVTPASLQGLIASATAQVTTSGTSIDVTGIPSWVKRITINLMGVSLSDANLPMIQLGDSGGIEASGYTGTTGRGAAFTDYSIGFSIDNGGAAGNSITGQITLMLADAATNTWIASGVCFITGISFTVTVSGRKSLSAPLDRFRLTSTVGTGAFDAGSFNYHCE